MNRQIIFSQLAVIMMSLSLLTGCMSVRHTSSLLPTSPANLFLKDVKVRIATASAPGITRDHLASIAQQTHPLVFSDRPDAMPLDVQISYRSDRSHDVTVLLAILSLGTLPYFETLKSDLSVRTTAADEMQGLILDENVPFERWDIGWISWYSPLGLIPVPGCSDFSRTTMLGLDTGLLIPEDWESTEHCCVEAIVQALLKGNLAKMQAACRHQATLVSGERFTVSGQILWCKRVAQATKAPADPVPDMLLGEIYLAKPGPGTKPVETVPLAQRISANTWQATPQYLQKTMVLCVATAVIEDGVPVRTQISEVKEPPLEDYFLDLRADQGTANMQWRTRVLLQAKNRTLPGLLKEGNTDKLVELATKIEQAVLAVDHQASLAKDRAQQIIEKGNGDPAADREISYLCTEHLAVLKVILAAIKEELANRQR